MRFTRRALVGAAMLVGPAMLQPAIVEPAIVDPALAAAPLKIGVIATWTGPYADYGRQFDNGMAVYLREHGGRIAGRTVELVRKDTSGAAPDTARRFA